MTQRLEAILFGCQDTDSPLAVPDMRQSPTRALGPIDLPGLEQAAKGGLLVDGIVIRGEMRTPADCPVLAQAARIHQAAVRARG